MSLDVYLISNETFFKRSSGIFVRENGVTKEITEKEWNERNPGREPVKIIQNDHETNELYSANITHNLGVMANKAGIYEALWRPHRLKVDYNIPEDDYDSEYKFETNSVTKASEIIPILEDGLNNLKEKPDFFKQFNASNGWGLYENFVPFVENYLNACREYPDAIVQVSR